MGALLAAQNALACRSLPTSDLYNRPCADFPSRLLHHEALAWSLTKPQIYLARLVSVIQKQELQSSGISSKAIKHPFD